MIFTGRHLGFSEFAIYERPNIFINDFIQFFYLENIGVDTKSMLLCQLEVEILPKLDFQAAI